MDANTTNVFDDVEQYRPPAAVGRRFANYLIDLVLFYGLYVVAMIGAGIILRLNNGPEFDIAYFLETIEGKLMFWAIFFAVFIGSFTFIEGVTKGRSLGKLITGTVAIRTDGQAFTWRNALMRSLYRLIPFEAFSAFGGYPWHDGMTKTSVVRK